MRRRTVRSGLRFMIAGIVCVILATFFPAQVSNLLFGGMADEGKLTFLGFFLGWMLSGYGALWTVAGFVQSGGNAERVRLAPSFLLLVSLVILFFVLAYDSMVSPPRVPPLQPGETINI